MFFQRDHRLFLAVTFGLFLPFLLQCGGGSRGPTTSGDTSSDGPGGVVRLEGYPCSRIVGYFGMPLPPIRPHGGVNYNSFAVEPRLPPGLSLNASDGTLSGTPLEEVSEGTFQITAFGASGTASANVILKIEPVPMFAQNEVFYSETGLLASVPKIPGFSYRWSVQDLGVGVSIVKGADGNVLTYATGPTTGNYELTVQIKDGSGHSCTVRRVLRSVENCFLKDVHTPLQRGGATSTSLLDGTLLVVGGLGNLGPAISSSEIFDPTTRNWALCGDMASTRFYHSATRLHDGRVLVVGGRDENQSTLASAEIYSPSTRTWMSVSELPAPRTMHTATLLPDGDVLLVGGEGLPQGSQSNPCAHAFRFHPATASWSSVGDMSYPRSGHSATLLPDGRILVVGGNASSPRSDAELFDPLTNRWRTLPGGMRVGREGHTANLLLDGRVLIQGNAGADIFNPKTETWNSTGVMVNEFRNRSNSTLLPDGRVLVIGGENDLFSTSELYDPSTNTWSQAGVTPFPSRSNVTLATLPGGHVLLAGGASIYRYMMANPYLFDIASSTWTALGAEGMDRFFHTATSLVDGQVLFVGGFESFAHGGSLSSTLLFNGAMENPWIRVSDMSEVRQGHVANLLSSGSVLVAAGEGHGYTISTTEIFEPSTGNWRLSPDVPGYGGSFSAISGLKDKKVLLSGGLNLDSPKPMTYLFDEVEVGWKRVGDLNVARYGHTSDPIIDGTVMVVGGQGILGALDCTEIYNPITQIWSKGSSLVNGRVWHTSTPLMDGKILVVGGNNGDCWLKSVEIYDPVQKSWTLAGELNDARTYHSATRLPDGKVLVVGGYDGKNLISSAELYDPIANIWLFAGNLVAPRSSNTATQLPDGKVLIAGGDLGYIPEFWKPAVQISSGPRTGAYRQGDPGHRSRFSAAPVWPRTQPSRDSVVRPSAAPGAIPPRRGDGFRCLGLTGKNSSGRPSKSLI